MRNTSSYIKPVILLIVLLLIEMQILGNLFPWTGLKAIIVFPIIFGIWTSTIVFGVFVTRKISNFKSRTAIWSVIFLINALITAQMYPQEFRPTALKQIGYTFNVIYNYETITKDDLELYREDRYYPYDKSIPDDRERYIAALCKFRNEVNRDGSSFIYGDRDKPILENTNIEKHFKSGQDKLIWWLIETFKKDK